jgi:hypothetical protein
LVLRLSICFWNTACQKSLQMNFMMSSVSPSRGLSLLYLRGPRQMAHGAHDRQQHGRGRVFHMHPILSLPEGPSFAGPLLLKRCNHTRPCSVSSSDT